MRPRPIHLDTSFLIRALRPGSDEDRILRSLLAEGQELAMSAIAWTEFLCGPLDSGQLQITRRLVPEIVAFTEKDTLQAAELFNSSGRRRSSLTDCMIAAITLRCNARLATSNRKDFERLGVPLIG